MNTNRLLTFILTIITLTSGYAIKRSKDNGFVSVTTDVPKIKPLPYMVHSRDGRQMFDELSTKTPSVTNAPLTTTVPAYTVAYYICFMITEYIGPCTCKPQQSIGVTDSTSDDFIEVSTKSTTVDSENFFNKSTTINNESQTTILSGSTTENPESVYQKPSNTITNDEPQTTVVSSSTTDNSVDVSTKSPTTTKITNEPQTTIIVTSSTTDNSVDVSTKSPTTTKITNEPQTTIIVTSSTTDNSVDVSTKSPTTTKITNEPQTTTLDPYKTSDSDVTTESSATITTVSNEEDESGEYDDLWDIYIWIAIDDD